MMNHAERMARLEESDLYVVITESFCAGRKSIEILDAVLAAGVKLVQCREKELNSREYYELAMAFRTRTREAGALLIVDDRLDIALATFADGVHLGFHDLPIDAARRLAPELIIGASAHDLPEALAAQDAGASYVNIGPIFDTRTKVVNAGAVGTGLIGEIRPHLRVPFTVMGGIKRHNIGQVLERGARHVAVVTAVTAADHPQAAAKELRATMAAH